MNKEGRIIKKIRRLKILCNQVYEYCMDGVWSDPKNTPMVNFIKTVNLSVHSFLDKNLQLTACALTYNTILALVPALALLFAVGRGFGFKNLLQSELFKYFPAQQEALSKAFSFVDSYLEQSSEGWFLGIGIIFLLWTLISLMSNVEQVFNNIWGIKKGRSIYRKITDYTAIFIMLPILMICAGGISIFMNTIAKDSFFSPVLTFLLDAAPYVLIWLFFAGTFMLIPYTKVKFKYAFIAGVLCGTSYQILQWLFVSGQLYVSKYNAIYGSFAFLPLLLIWLQLTWLICIAGVVLTYSSQNIFKFNFKSDISDISQNYRDNVTIVIYALIVDKFVKGEIPFTKSEIADKLDIPIRLCDRTLEKLSSSGLVSRIYQRGEGEDESFQPAMDVENQTVGFVLKKIRDNGKSFFLKQFDSQYEIPISRVIKVNSQIYETPTILIKELLKTTKI